MFTMELFWKLFLTSHMKDHFFHINTFFHIKIIYFSVFAQLEKREYLGAFSCFPFLPYLPYPLFMNE